jgi:hypothetical protein
MVVGRKWSDPGERYYGRARSELYGHGEMERRENGRRDMKARVRWRWLT